MLVAELVENPAVALFEDEGGLRRFWLALLAVKTGMSRIRVRPPRIFPDYLS